MRIEEVIVTPIALGDAPLLNAAGLRAPWALRIVVELVTDAGVVGLSELPGDPHVLACLRRARGHLRGQRVFDRHAIGMALEQVMGRDGSRGPLSWDERRLVHAVSAMEVACLDAIGKHWNCRVADLLGGVRRERVPFAGYLFFKYEGAGGALGFDRDPSAAGWRAARQAPALDETALVAQAAAMVDAFGFASLKVKAGILDPDLEVGAVLALRDTFGPDLPLRIDPNGVWSYETALRQGQRLAGVIEYYEDPVRGQEAMAKLRRELRIPLATNMCTTGFEDLPGSVARGSEDIILADPHYWGGLHACMTLASICTVFDRQLSVHSNSHAGISLAAMVQLGAALPELPYALDTHYPWQEDEVITGGRLTIENGAVALPDGPGLGVTLDHAALARQHAAYRACGLTCRDDEAAMQAKQPGWRFQATRY